jgi:hypothetical protein
VLAESSMSSIAHIEGLLILTINEREKGYMLTWYDFPFVEGLPLVGDYLHLPLRNEPFDLTRFRVKERHFYYQAPTRICFDDLICSEEESKYMLESFDSHQKSPWKITHIPRIPQQQQ